MAANRGNEGPVHIVRKAITLQQPWASLVAHGLKTIETRTWNTNYRGTLAIHAAKRQPFVPVNWSPALVQRVTKVIGPISNLPLGCIVALCSLDECVSTRHLYDWRPEYREEYEFGIFTNGRFAWLLSNIRRIVPVPARGMQGFWKWRQDRNPEFIP